MIPANEREFLLALIREHQAFAGKERPRRRTPIRNRRPIHEFAVADRTCPRCHYTFASRFGELWSGGICAFCAEDEKHD